MKIPALLHSQPLRLVKVSILGLSVFAATLAADPFAPDMGDPHDPSLGDPTPGDIAMVPAIPDTGTATATPPQGYTLTGSYSIGTGFVIPAEAGIILSTDASPSFDNGTRLLSSYDGTGNIEVSTGPLTAGTTYYFRAFAGGDQTSASVNSFTTPVVNSAPTNITLTKTTFNQSSGLNSQISVINVTDPDSSDTHTFALVSGTGAESNSLFTISNNILHAVDTRTTPAGAHNIRIQATDNSGATFAKALTITAIDNLPPDAPTVALDAASDSGTAGDNRTNVNRPTFTIAAEAGSTVKLYWSSPSPTLLGQGTIPESGGSINITLADALADGQYGFHATATDALNNVSSEGSISRSVIIDTVAPVITSSPTLTLEYGEAVSHHVTASGFPETFLALSGLPDTLTFSSSGQLTGTPDASATHTINLAVADDVGNTALQTLNLTVSPKTLTVQDLIVLSKNYDGTADAQLRTDIATLVGVINDDDVALDLTHATAVFTDAAVQSPKTANITGVALAGADIANYTLTPVTTLSASNGIQPGVITVTGVTAIDRVYNGLAAVDLDTSKAVLTGTAEGDDVAIDLANTHAEVAQKIKIDNGARGFVGTDIPVFVSYRFTGADAGNYHSTRNAESITVNITPAPLTVTGITAEDKIADGTTTASIDTSGAQLQGVLQIPASSTESLQFLTVPGTSAAIGIDAPLPPTQPDAVALDTTGATGNFVSALPGTNVTVNISGLALTGTSAGNYTLADPTATATITSASQPQTITFDGPANKRSNDPAFDLEATATSGLPVTFTVVSGPALIADHTITPTGATGTVTIRADQAGNSEWDPAPPVTRAFEITQVGPLVYFGTTSDGTEFAVNIPEGNSVGTLFGKIAATGQFYILTFEVAADRSITALSLQILGDPVTTARSLVARPLRKITSGEDPAPTTAAALEYTFSGTLVGGVLNFQIAELGITLTGTIEPADGSTAALAGLYESSSLNSANGTTTSIVGTTGKVFVLAVTPGLVTGGAGTIASNGSFNLQTSDAVSISGNVDAPSTTVSGTIILPDGEQDAFAGLSTDTLRTDRLINLSTRARITPATGGTLITGFVVGGETPKALLLRAVGPTLADFGITAAMEDPGIAVYDASGTVVAQNDNWGGDPTTAAIMARIGAFALPPDSQDAAIVASLPPGPYTMHVTSQGEPGIAIAEIYDAAENPNSQYQRLINISSRGHVAGGQNVLVGGFIVTGNSPKRVLVRGIGPALADYGVTGALANPQLKVYNQDQQVVATNDDWETAATVFSSQRTATPTEITQANAAVGAFALGEGSADAALIVTLQPGAYTVEISSADAATGNALIEIYEIPE